MGLWGYRNVFFLYSVARLLFFFLFCFRLGMKVPFKSTMLEVYDTPQDFFRWNLAAHNASLQIPLNGNSKSFYDNPLEFKKWNDAHKLSGS